MFWLPPGSTLIDPLFPYSTLFRSMLASGARCRTFDAAADGYVRAEGCAVVMLKPLSRARADGDRILGVIRGSAANHDGASGGFTVPSGTAQEAVIREIGRAHV